MTARCPFGFRLVKTWGLGLHLVLRGRASIKIDSEILQPIIFILSTWLGSCWIILAGNVPGIFRTTIILLLIVSIILVSVIHLICNYHCFFMSMRLLLLSLQFYHFFLFLNCVIIIILRLWLIRDLRIIRVKTLLSILVCTWILNGTNTAILKALIIA